jgi:hypothetical protein
LTFPADHASFGSHGAQYLRSLFHGRSHGGGGPDRAAVPGGDVRDESIFGKDAGRGGEALAVMAFTGLVNSFAVSLLAMIPGANVGVSAMVLAVLSLVGSVRLNCLAEP